MKTSIDPTSPVNSQHDGSASLSNNGNDTSAIVVNDNDDSPMSNIKYGVGMLAFIAIPPLIPGVTIRLIIIGYMCLIISIYMAAAIMAAIRIRHPTLWRKRHNKIIVGKSRVIIT
jgi:hypothetical protein